MSIYADIEKTLGDFHLNVKLEAGDEVLALLGASGCGKSMTLKCIAGIVRPDRGRIEVDGRVLFDSEKHIDLSPQQRRTGLMFQNYALFPNMTVLQNIRAGARREKDSAAKERKIQEIMDSFGLAELSAHYPWQLSGGQQQRTALARLLVSGPDILLLDEPFSALDSHLRFRLERELAEVIRDFGRTVILVSHDRCFLDGCVDHILSINRSDIEVQRGNFSTWFTNFQRQQGFELAQNKKLKKSIDTMQKSAQRTSAWSDRMEASKYGNGPVDRGYIGHKSAKMMKRSKSVQIRQQRAIEEKSRLLKNLETTEDLKIAPLLYHTDTLVTFSNVVPVFDGKDICRPISFSVKQGERIALDGKNGSGKTSLLKLLTGQHTEHRGTIAIGSGVILSYVPQDTSMLNGSLSEFAKASQIDESLFKAILRKMDFSRIQFEKKMEDFSAGQKKKVLIARSLCEQAHLYVWDEPLNYIDIYSRMQIEKLIEEFSPTMIFVEHDLAFRKNIATRTVYFSIT